jgi:GNAT superfamily N-acetyltransferase
VSGPSAPGAGADIAPVGAGDLDELVALMRGYCEFYGADPPDGALLAMARALIADPAREGVQLLARDAEGRAVGFATVYWLWSTLSASRVGLMNDLYIAPAARGTGLADALIGACVARCRQHGATVLEWQTAKDNHRAQAVYDRIGGRRAEWLDYTLPVER